MKTKRLKYVLLACTILALTVAAAACGAKKDQDTAAQESTDRPAEDTAKSESGDAQASEGSTAFGDFQSETIDGEAVDQSIFTEADLTMVNVWGTFCGPCIREMPELAELSKEYVGRGLKIVGIISDVRAAGDETAIEIIKETGADYTHIVASGDLAQTAYSQLPNVVPATLFVDKGGNIVGDVYAGAKSKDKWSAIIEETLGEVGR